MDLEKFIREVTRKPGVSGYEAESGSYIAEQFRPLVDSVEVDVMQNVIARVGTEGPRVMLSAHQDEIGLVITKIEDDGSVRIYCNGGVDPRILPGLEVEIQAAKGPVYGVIGSLPPHLQNRENADKPVDFESLFVDTGYPTEKVRELVRVGDPVIMLAEPVMLSDGAMACKTMDDRANVAAMLVCAEELKKMNYKMQVCFVASTQEEVGCRGAQTAAFGLDPDWVIAIDVTHGEGPGTGRFEAFPLEKVVIERGPLIHKALGRKLESVAQKHRIPFEISVSSGSTGTDTDNIQKTHGGIPCTLLSVPLRYMHTTVETLRLDVIRDAGRLMALMIAEMADEWEEFKWC